MNEAILQQRRSLSRLLSWLVVISIPSLVLFFSHTHSWPIWESCVVALAVVVGFRVAIEFVVRKLVPSASLFGVDDPGLKHADVLERRRLWFWKFWFKIGLVYAVLCSAIVFPHFGQLPHEALTLLPSIFHKVGNPSFLLEGIQVMFLFVANFAIFMGPMLLMGITQMKLFEPGDASWGVTMDQVRGQKEAKEEIQRVVNIWQYGDEFEKAGGKRPRGVIFFGSPGTGKSLTAKAIATGFGCPFITMPGSGFSAAFIGIDAVIVRVLSRKAKKAARKWGGTCIVFIDEIDAVGRRRSQLGGGGMVGGMMGMGGMGMGQLALNQLLVVMDSMDSPPAFKMFWVKKINTLADALFIVPEKIGKVSLRIPPLRPPSAQVYWVGATNVELDALDPALTRAGRMGTHITFKNPSLADRADILDLYISKVAHEADLDTPERRDEIARIAQGLSPADIEQLTSMALISAQHDGRMEFNFQDLVNSLTNLESGVAIGLDYTPKEARATAIHEAGHAAAAHIYRPDMESSRLSIKARGRSLGHHQSFAKEERFSKFRSEEFGSLVHGLAAMAAEYVFYDENTRGVSGDLDMVTQQAAQMVGVCGMAPYFVDSEAMHDVVDRFEKIGQRLLNRTHEAGQKDGVGSIIGSPAKSRDAAIFLGHAFVTAWNFIRVNKVRVDAVATELVAAEEIYGNELMTLLDAQKFEKFDPLDGREFVKITNWPVMG